MLVQANLCQRERREKERRRERDRARAKSVRQCLNKWCVCVCVCLRDQTLVRNGETAAATVRTQYTQAAVLLCLPLVDTAHTHTHTLLAVVACYRTHLYTLFFKIIKVVNADCKKDCVQC